MIAAYGPETVEAIFEIASDFVEDIKNQVELILDNDGGDDADTALSVFEDIPLSFSAHPVNPFWLGLRFNADKLRTPDGAISLASRDITGASVPHLILAATLDLFPMIYGSYLNPIKSQPRNLRHRYGYWRWSQLLHPLIVQDIVRNIHKDEWMDRMDIHLEQNTLGMGFSGGSNGDVMVAQGTPGLPSIERIPTRLHLDQKKAKDLAEPGKKLLDVIPLGSCGIDHIDKAVEALIIEGVGTGPYGTEIRLKPCYHIGLDDYPDDSTAKIMRVISMQR